MKNEPKYHGNELKLFKECFIKAKINNVIAFEFKGNFYMTNVAKEIILNSERQKQLP